MFYIFYRWACRMKGHGFCDKEATVDIDRWCSVRGHSFRECMPDLGMPST